MSVSHKEILPLYIMEVLNAYLRDLLVLHDCVILPDFGGFVGNYKSAEKAENDYFNPPQKAIAFNPQLQHSDGLLANTITAIENITYDEAMQRIAAFTANLKKELKATGFYNIPSVGKLERGEQGRIFFTPDTTTNLLLSPVGMYAFRSTPHTNLQATVSPKQSTPQGRIVAMPVLRKVLVAGVSGFALLSLLLNPGNFENLSLASLAPSIEVNHNQITAPETTNTSTEIPTRETVTDEVTEVVSPTIKKYHVIVGCFSMEKNATIQKSQLEAKQIATVIFPYSQELTAVSAGSFSTFEEAKILMDELRSSGNAPSAWVLKRQILN